MLSTPLRRLALAAAVTALVLPCLLAGPAAAAGPRGHPIRSWPSAASHDHPRRSDLRRHRRRRPVLDRLRPPPRRLLRAVRRPGRRASPRPARRRGSTRWTIDLSDGTLDAGDVTVLAVTTLRGPDGQPFPALSLDPEGLTLTRDDRSSSPPRGSPPRASRRSSASSTCPASRSPSCRCRATSTRSTSDPRRPAEPGLRGGRGRPARAALFVGAENALAQDGPAATTTTGSNARLLRYHLGKTKHHGPHRSRCTPPSRSSPRRRCSP